MEAEDTILEPLPCFIQMGDDIPDLCLRPQPHSMREQTRVPPASLCMKDREIPVPGPLSIWGPWWHDLGWDSACKECFLWGATGWHPSSFGVVLHLCSEPCCISTRSCAASPHTRWLSGQPLLIERKALSAHNALNRCTSTFLFALTPPVSFSYFLF